jgi:uncharacterized membrane protein
MNNTQSTNDKQQKLKEAAEAFLNSLPDGQALLKNLRRQHNLTLLVPVRGALKQGAAKQAATSHAQQVITLARKRGFNQR